MSRAHPPASGHDLFGEPMTMPAQRFAARLARTLIADGEGFVTHDVPVLALSLEGIVGDRHAGHARAADSRVPWYPRGTPIRNSRQVSLVSPMELAEIARRLNLPQVKPEWVGANLVLEGIAELTQLPPGTRLHFAGGAALVIEGENKPCRSAGAQVAHGHKASDEAGDGNVATAGDLDLAFVRAAAGLRGLVAWIERAGDIAAGTQIEVRVPAQRPWTR